MKSTHRTSQPNIDFQVAGQHLKLWRYPKARQHKTLQAWDSADQLVIEYICQHMDDQQLQSMVILNDDFGALGCFFHAHHPHWYQDSKVSHLALADNLQNNQLSASGIITHHCLEPIHPARLIVIKIPKNLALLEHQLIQIQHTLTKDCLVVGAGKVNLINKNCLALFEKYLGPTSTSLAQKKSRLLFCQPQPGRHNDSPYPTLWAMPDHQWTIANHANVFSRQSIDIGGRFLLGHLPDCDGRTVFDLGCGNGIIGLAVLASCQNGSVVFIDESQMAITSARQNVQHNQPERYTQCQFIQSNCLEQLGDIKPDIVLCNPPFHQNNTITDHIAWQMFQESYQQLPIGGELRIVGNRHLDYGSKLKRLFGGYQQIASNNKFIILSSIKR